MNDNLDDWLNSLGMETATTVADNTPNASSADDRAHPIVREAVDAAISRGDLPPEPQALSDSDFDDILGDFGFDRPQDVEAEEVIDEDEEDFDAIDPTAEDDSYDENIGEGRDLDAEEDADWDNAFEQGLIREVDIERAEIQTAVASSEINRRRHREEQVHFHMPDGEVVDVPIVHEEAPQEEQTSSAEPLLPLNSPTLLLDESTSRFSGAEWFDEIQRQSIIVAGVGGIGSNLVFQLARMHPASLFMYDDDMVEAVNMSGQLYARNDIGKSKVAAMTDMITAYTNMQNVYAIKDRFTANTEAGNIMMCGFDNMQARKEFFRAWCNRLDSMSDEDRKKCLFLDGRLSIDTLQVFCIVGDDVPSILRYSEQYLFDDSEAEHTVCSMKQTTYLACMIGSLMTNLFTNFVANLLDPIIPYDLPFFTEYDAQNMIFKTVK